MARVEESSIPQRHAWRVLCLLCRLLCPRDSCGARRFWCPAEARNWEARCDRKRFSNNLCRRNGRALFLLQDVRPCTLRAGRRCGQRPELRQDDRVQDRLLVQRRKKSWARSWCSEAEFPREQKCLARKRFAKTGKTIMRKRIVMRERTCCAAWWTSPGCTVQTAHGHTEKRQDEGGNPSAG